MSEVIRCPVCNKRMLDINCKGDGEVELEIKCTYCRNIVKIIGSVGKKKIQVKTKILADN